MPALIELLDGDQLAALARLQVRLMTTTPPPPPEPIAAICAACGQPRPVPAAYPPYPPPVPAVPAAVFRAERSTP
jgi:hypothetical protein